MLVSDNEPQLCTDAISGPGREATGPPVPVHAAPYLQQLRDALDRIRLGAEPDGLQSAFAAASGVVATLTPVRGGERPDLEEMRRLATALPEFGAFLSCAADEAGRIVAAGTSRLWLALGLRSVPPAWTPEEREAARMLFACACAPVQDTNPARLRGGLRSLAAARIARLLAAELSDGEDVWVTALRERYDSVRHRCAPRTTWRSRGLSELLRADDVARRAVTARLEHWLAAGGDPGALAAELEAALVHARTPARFA
ncbi:MAG TPA: hypothetical protein VG325_17440 [Solirubrobacteraceae bacterium]|nr:hypothetical protein [Solirubrobacteraceae bacterium]